MVLRRGRLGHAGDARLAGDLLGRRAGAAADRAASVVLWWPTHGDYDTSAGAWTSLVLLGVSSMYLGFFAWYRGLAKAGIARGGQVQQLQALLTLLWSALLLGEHVGLTTVLAAFAVIASVVWSQHGRAPTVVARRK